MKADVGDHLVVHGRHVNDPGRRGEIVEVHGEHGEPPYLVQWEGHHERALVIPGPDAHVEHATGHRS